MFTNAAHSASTRPAHPSQQGSPWPWALIAEVLPGLPCGALTLLLIDENNPCASHDATLLDLMAAMVEQNRPITHVAVGGPDDEVLLDDLSRTVNAEGQGRMRAFVDRAPKADGSGGKVSTLVNVANFLARVEGEGEQSLVVLDGFERARPYPAAGSGSMSRTARTRRANKQRTAELRDFARSRPNAPTVVVWHGSTTVAPEVKRSMGDAADVLLMHRMGAEGGWLSVNHRTPAGCWSRDH